MALRFNSLPPERKRDMLYLLVQWHGKDGSRRRTVDSEVLVNSLRILATPGSRAEFLRRQGHLSPSERVMLSIAFVMGGRYQGRGILSNDDAQMLLDLVREVRKLVPAPPRDTNTAIMRAAHALLDGEIPAHDERDQLWRKLTPFLFLVDQSLFQPSLF